jgi:hypothetical protein
MCRRMYDQLSENAASAPYVNSFVVPSDTKLKQECGCDAEAGGDVLPLAQQHFRRAVPPRHNVVGKKLAALPSSESEVADVDVAVLADKSVTE